MSVPDFPLRGLHDGAEYMLQQGARGWAIQPVYLSDLKVHPVDYSAHAAAGIRVVVRLSYSYARDSPGGQGTFPPADRLTAFEQAAIQTVNGSKGVAAWILGNEPNRKAEWPADDQPISTDQVVSIYNAVYDSLPLGEACPVSPPAIDPTNYESGDPLDYFQRLLAGIHGAERFALHAYGYGASEPIDSDSKFQPPMQWQFHGFRMWEPFAAALYASRYRETPILITETSPLFKRDGSPGWDDDAGLWIEDADAYVAGWNAGPGSQYVHCLALYRYQGDAWALADKPQLLAIWAECGEQAVAGGPVPPPLPPPPEPGPVWGPDVSKWQGEVDWSQVKASGAAFCFVKATEGTGYTDPWFAANWAGAKAAGLPRGAYMYFHSELDGAEQAAHFLATLNGDTGELPVAVDVEDLDEAAKATDPADLEERLSTCLAALAAGTGRLPILYTGAWWWDVWVGNMPWARAFPLWAASYPKTDAEARTGQPVLPAGFTRWSFWQTSSSGAVQGIAGAVDMNRFHGTLEELRGTGGPLAPLSEAFGG